MIQLIKEFEIANADNFESKVDLAYYFFNIREYDYALEYCVRAESVIKNAFRSDFAKLKKENLYSIRAHLEYLRGNYNESLDYISKNKSLTKKSYNLFFLEGQCYFALNEEEKALEYFAKGDSMSPETKTPNDELTHAYLLFNKENYTEAEKCLNSFFATGGYTSEAAQLGSAIYEKLNNIAKEFLCVFLDFEFHNNYYNLNTENFLTEICSDNSSLTLNQLLEKDGVTKLINSYYTDHNILSTDIDFPASQFIVLANKIESNNFTTSDLEQFLKLETLFNKYPSYYWYGWKAFNIVDGANSSNYVPMLQRIILLGYNNIYIPQARQEMGRIIGLNAEQSENLLLPQEVQYNLKSFIETGDSSFITPVIKVLDLPENDYERSAMIVVTDYINNVSVVNQLKLQSENGSLRLKERINYLVK